MLNSNARRAMAAAAGGSQITQIASVTASSEYPQTWWEPDVWPSITGSTTENRLTASASNTIGWYFNIAKWDASQTTQGWSFTSLSAMNSGNAAVEAGEVLYAYTEYVGIETLPQSTTLTIRNATYGNEIVWQITVTVNPEPV